MSTGNLWLDWLIALAFVGLIWGGHRLQKYNENRMGRKRTLTFADGTTATMENYSARDEAKMTKAFSKMYGPVTADREELTEEAEA